MTDWIRNIVRMVRDELETQTRFGFYVGTVTNALQSFRRADVQPEWLEVDSESLEKLLRIASPILDVVYAVGTRVAVISQDGLPEAGAVLGAVTDDKQDGSARTVWIRADLEQHTGHIEIGATKGVRIFVGTNPGDLTPVSEDDIELECDGEIRLGASASAGVADGSKADRILAALDTALSGWVVVAADGGAALKAAYAAATLAQVPPYTAGSPPTTESSKVKAE